MALEIKVDELHVVPKQPTPEMLVLAEVLEPHFKDAKLVIDPKYGTMRGELIGFDNDKCGGNVSVTMYHSSVFSDKVHLSLLVRFNSSTKRIDEVIEVAEKMRQMLQAAVADLSGQQEGGK